MIEYNIYFAGSDSIEPKFIELCVCQPSCISLNLSYVDSLFTIQHCDNATLIIITVDMYVAIAFEMRA